ncbi:MAG: phosphoribosylformylglycinamidine synthase subunit PurS [Candidatus Wallbacteria bacterium]|nr:phosphoribosylformylglycinamidine synthase subunit PurS [Candidatus Wallbacteria bacterium]
MFQAEVLVYLRPSIQDPQGVVIERTLQQLGFADLQKVRTGKYFRLSLAAKNSHDAQKEAERMCRELLANTVIEDYRVEVREA